MGNDSTYDPEAFTRALQAAFEARDGQAARPRITLNRLEAAALAHPALGAIHEARTLEFAEETMDDTAALVAAVAYTVLVSLGPDGRGDLEELEYALHLLVDFSS